MRKRKRVPPKPMTLTVTTEAGQPVRTRVRFDNPEDESRAYKLSVEAARLAEPLRRLVIEAEDSLSPNTQTRPVRNT